MNDLLNLAVDYYLQDKQEVSTSVRLTTTQHQDHYFRATCISDYHNIFRRKYQKLMKRDISDPVAIRQQIQIEQSKHADDTLPDALHMGMTSAPPYNVDVEPGHPRQHEPLTRDSSKVAFLAHLLQEKLIKANAKLKKSGPMISMARAKDLVFAQLNEKRKKPERRYKLEDVFAQDFLETKPEGIRHGGIEAEESIWESLPEHEIHDEQRPATSDMLIDSGHHASVGALKPMRGTGHLNFSEQYPGSMDRVAEEERYNGNFSHHRLVNSLAWYQLNELRGMKAIILSDSTFDPTTSFPYLQSEPRGELT